jgi:hypothetical protein
MVGKHQAKLGSVTGRGTVSGKDMLVFFKEPMAAVTVDTTKTQKAFLEATKRPTAKKLADKLGEVRTAWIATRDEINKLKDAGDDVGAAQLVDSRFVPITDQYIAAAQELVNGQVAEMDQLKTEIEDAFASLYKWLTVMTLAGDPDGHFRVLALWPFVW